MILGSGPNRIGQGIEFDYCCCHAAFALHEAGYETIMVNCNPETVSTDYDTSDRLYFEPLTFEDVMNIVDVEKPDGVIVQFGGQTPLNLAMPLHQRACRSSAPRPTPSTSLRIANVSARCSQARNSAAGKRHGDARSKKREQLRHESVIRCWFVRVTCSAGARWRSFTTKRVWIITCAPPSASLPIGPVLIDKFLEQAVEFDVDALADETTCVIAGIQEHIEEAGIHSGDSSCVLPPVRTDPEHIETMRLYTRKMAQALGVRGLMNVQFAIKDHRVYVLEVNPRASRTVPFVSKATGVPLARIASLVMAGASLKNFNLPDKLTVTRFFVKSPVFPFAKFPEVDPVLGPEMHSTGEVMGIGDTFGEAYGKAMTAAGLKLPPAAPRSSASTTPTKARRCYWRAGWSVSGSSSWPRREQHHGCAKSGLKVEKFSKSTKAAPISWTTSSNVRSR